MLTITESASPKRDSKLGRSLSWIFLNFNSLISAQYWWDGTSKVHQYAPFFLLLKCTFLCMIETLCCQKLIGAYRMSFAEKRNLPPAPLICLYIGIYTHICVYVYIFVYICVYIHTHIIHLPCLSHGRWNFLRKRITRVQVNTVHSL